MLVGLTSLTFLLALFLRLDEHALGVTHGGSDAIESILVADYFIHVYKAEPVLLCVGIDLAELKAGIRRSLLPLLLRLGGPSQDHLLKQVQGGLE